MKNKLFFEGQLGNLGTEFLEKLLFLTPNEAVEKPHLQPVLFSIC